MRVPSGDRRGGRAGAEPGASGESGIRSCRQSRGSDMVRRCRHIVQGGGRHGVPQSAALRLPAKWLLPSPTSTCSSPSFVAPICSLTLHFRLFCSPCCCRCGIFSSSCLSQGAFPGSNRNGWYKSRVLFSGCKIRRD
jgi:hypothetical protein